MSRYEDFLKEILDIEKIEEIEFKTINECELELTFVFLRNSDIYRDKITNCEIRPLGIIYMQNEDYYFAPLSEFYDLNKIIKSYSNHLI